MKICTKCKINKKLIEFSKHKRMEDGLQQRCKNCTNLYKKKYRTTFQGVVSRIYESQITNSKARGHHSPLYTKDELNSWLLNDWLFGLLYDNWCNCGYLKDMKPSIDRLDDSKGYSFDNIQVMTCKENIDKSRLDMRNGKLISSKPQKAVVQFTKDGIFIKEFVSAYEASRQTSINQGNICQCCLNKNHHESAGGFKWKFKIFT